MAVTKTRRRGRSKTNEVNGALDRESECFTIPATAGTLAGFRAWSHSDTFPERGKITFIAGEIIVDMSPERLDSHGEVKTEICRVLANLVVKLDLGRFYIDSTRVVNKKAAVSNEPDAVFVSRDALASKRIRKVPSEKGKDHIEFEGTPDWVLEIVSPGSVTKDTVKLRKRYRKAGIPEYWLIDAREDEISFEILVHHADGYQAAPNQNGWIQSTVFGKRFRLRRFADDFGDRAYRLDMK